MRRARAVLLSGVLAMPTTPSCKGDEANCRRAFKTSTEPYSGEYMFEPCSVLAVALDPGTFRVGDDLHLTFSCEPAFDGLGTLTVQFLPEAQSAAYTPIDVVSPSVEALPGYYYTAPAVFHRGVRFQSTWTIRIRSVSAHQVFGAAAFDSVCADTGSCYPIGSAEARAMFGPLSTRPAANYPGVVIPEPSMGTMSTQPNSALHAPVAGVGQG